MKTWVQQHALLSFFSLTYAIAFGVTFAYIALNPGQTSQRWSLDWFLNAFSPTISALIIAWIIGGGGEVKRLISGFTRWNVGLFWYFAAAFLFLGPLAFALVYGALGNPIPGIQPGTTLSLILGQLLFNLFSGPLAEEAGWRGFALPRLQSKYNALVSSLILGVIWCFWHLPLFFLPGSSQQGIPFPIYLLLVVILGIYFTWLYNNTRGSLIITVLAHFSFNISGGFIAGTLGLLPPMVLYIAAGSTLMLAVIGIVFYFGGKTLSKKPVHIVSICLLSGLLFSACTPLAQPQANNTAPSATLVAENPLETEASPEATPEPATAGCPVTGEPRYVNNLYGYCFAYPEGFTVQVQTAQGPALVGPALEEAADPLRVSLTISARPAPESADLSGLVTGFLGQSPLAELPAPPERTTIQLGGEPAEALEPVPGRLSSRVVSALHGATFYQLYFTPTDVQQAEAGVEDLYETVLASFAFFPVAPQVPAGPETANYFEFGRIFSFTYDLRLALMVEARTVEAVPVSPEVMFAESHPAFAQFSFLGYDGGRLFQLPYPFQTPRLMAFPIQDFAGFGAEAATGFPQQLEDLRRLLETQPDLAERCTRTAPVSGDLGLPFLPWLNSAQVFCAQPQYIEFNGGKGIRYLTAFSQGIEPLVDPSIFYTFQGISEDGEFYFSAVFPVLPGIFPLEIHPGVEDQQPQNMTAEQLSALNAQSGDLFQPALGQLDALVSSLEAKK